ncbi:MAG: DCC1-like thiol-disulfide oxidoreductase family protein, partial [Candidatus Omnitrophica bacterium]|nr:DCC1-like thiol-disulfide oxidoreductase family protein [Candidatus Omnitrophota bacterium]
YHGDFFSLDSLIKVGEGYRRKRPYFLQRLLQIQIGFTFFYTALWKIFPVGNWLSSNPIYYLMHKPPSGVTKWFLLRDFLKTQPELCYGLGVMILVSEFLLMFLLFWRRTRIAAIYLGVLFHVMLILTLDVPATFFFLFPAQLILFIHPDRIVDWIDEQRNVNQSARRPKILYDGQCGFCFNAVRRMQVLDLFARYEYIDFRAVADVSVFHLGLTTDHCQRELILIDSRGRLFGGFSAFRQMSLTVPLMFPLALIYYFPGMGLLGPFSYRLIARNRKRLPALFSTHGP